jgi:GxxExxY protein
MEKSDAEIEALTNAVIGGGIEVHRELGPGLLESIYQECLVIVLRKAGIPIEVEKLIPFDFKGHRLKTRLKIDLLVGGCIIVELKAVDRLHPIHSAQVITYLKLTGFPVGLLMNFNATTLKAGLKRLDHPARFLKKFLPPATP